MPKLKRSTNKQPADEMLDCARCGISFLWTIEEQYQAAGDDHPEVADVHPTLCPGCRYLLADTERERGLVKWYDARKGYGFVTRPNGIDIFAHVSELKGIRALQPGDLVEFGIEETERGLAACGVRLLGRNMM